MKKINVLLLLLFPCSLFSSAQDQEKSKTKIYYSYDQLEEDEFWNTETYPRPDLPENELRQFIRSRITYPELARKHFRSSRFVIPLDISVAGKATLGYMLSSGNPEFEDMAISVLTDSSLKWKPARRNKNLKNMTILVPVSFHVYYHEDKMYFAARFFINFDRIVLDSTNTYPAMYPIDSAYFIDNRRFLTPYLKTNDKPYGAVTVGFEIDTAGLVADQKIVTSVNETLDSIALDFIARSDGKWISARKNGTKVPSYKYFDCLFNDLYSSEKNTDNYVKTRNNYEKNLQNGYAYYRTIAQEDKISAMSLLADKKYKESIERFDRAARYYIKDVNLFFNRSVAHYNAGNKNRACDDLQRVLDLAETEGFPAGISKQSVEELIIKHCQ